MDIRILVLDDQLETAGSQIRDSLRPLMIAEERLTLSGSRTATLELQEIDGEEVLLHFSCNPVDYARHVKQLIEEGRFKEQYDLVLLDDNWGPTSAEKFAGQTLLLDPVFNHLKGPTEQGPMICLWTQHWDEPFRTERLAETLRREPFWGETRVRGLAKSNYPGLLLLVQDVIALSRLQRKTLQLEAALADTREVASNQLELLKSKQFRENLVPHDPFFRVAERLIPFFQWKNATYDRVRDDLKMGFPPGLFFSYQDEAWLTTVCETLAQAMGSQTYIIDAHFGMSNGDSDSLLLEQASEFYAKALHEPIVVIRAENITWPDDLDNQWQRFSQSLSNLLRTAVEINSGRIPTDQDLRSRIIPLTVNETPFPFVGKILWLLSHRNRATRGPLESIEMMFRPFIRLEFPLEESVRCDYLKIYANKHKCDFQPTALKLTSRRTHHYSFKDLFGDPRFDASGSFVSMAANKAKLEAQRNFNGTSRSSKPLITVQIVEQVLDEFDPVEEFISEMPSGSGSLEIQNASGLSNEARSARMLKAEQWLDSVEAAVIQAKKQNPAIPDSALRSEVASILGMSAANITIKVRSYEVELKTLLRDPQKAANWPNVVLISTFKKLR